MAFSQSSTQAFYLTSQNDSPLLHAILEPHYRVWQYVVIDPGTRHGIIIDPIYAPTDSTIGSTLKGTEDIMSLVKSQGYLIDHIFETGYPQQSKRTAAWSLRMQLLDHQGFAPELCSNGAVSVLRRTFARKYGPNNFSTTLGTQYNDLTAIRIGSMKVVVLATPFPGAEEHKSYLIGGAIFGAHSSAMAGRKGFGARSEESYSALSSPGNKHDLHALWKSMNRVLSLPPDIRIFFENDIDGSGFTQCTTVEQCRAVNPYVLLTEDEFIARRREELRELHAVAGTKPPLRCSQQ